MYKVLIVDDETIIADGLARVIPWADYRAEVVGVAYNTATAARMIRELEPDILFTDIRMPDGDGLTMLAGLNTEFPHMQITVLTGYREFNYAQKAIQLGVTRFLLKPSKMDELIEALGAMTAKLAERSPLPADPVDGEAEGEAGAEAGSFVVRQACLYIEEHCTEKISLSDVADACFVSQWHLSKLLNRHAGQAFYDLLNTARIELAKKLMLDPSLRIGDISERVGYIDTPHFSRVFKKIEGISAGEYRNSRITVGK
jgi:YesN/AraC family two-component response regulator